MSYMVQQLVLGILVDIYQIILFLILPLWIQLFLFNLLFMEIYPKISKHFEYSKRLHVQLPIYNEKYEYCGELIWILLSI